MTDYNNIAKEYENFNDLTEWEFGYKVVIEMLGSLKNKKILDYGCGNGKISRYVRDKGSFVTGVDKSKGMIETAKKYDNKNINFHVVSNNKIPFLESKSLDGAMINLVLCTIKDKNEISQILSELYRVLKLGSSLIILEPNPNSIGGNFVSFRSKKPENKVIGEPYKVYLYKHNKKPIELIDYFMLTKDYVKMIKKAGFKNLEIKEPLATKKDDKNWLDEKEKPPYIIFKAEK